MSKIRQSYEQFRDSFPLGEDVGGEPRVGPLWRAADRWREHYTDEVERVKADPELSEEGKANRIAAIHDRLGPKIEQNAGRAREKAQKLAEEYSERAVPFPGSVGHRYASGKIEDTSEFMAIQNEASAIAQMASSGSLVDKIAERTGKRPKNITETENKTLSNLQALYGEALEGTGFEAKIKAHATLRAARQLGVNPEDVYAPFRDERHTAALEEAQLYSQAAGMISTSAPSLERSITRSANHWRKGSNPRPATPQVGTYGSGRRATTVSQQRGPLFQKKRRPSWK
jgi:hypothetical protein